LAGGIAAGYGCFRPSGGFGPLLKFSECSAKGKTFASAVVDARTLADVGAFLLSALPRPAESNCGKRSEHSCGLQRFSAFPHFP